MRILNVADFNWMTGAERDTVNLSLFDICRKLGFAAIWEFPSISSLAKGLTRIKNLRTDSLRGRGWEIR